MARKPLEVMLEEGSTKVFAAAVGWPGWCRAGKNEEAALQALADYADRFAVVAKKAKVPFDPELAADLTVVERLPGGPATNFGAPEKTFIAERSRVTPAPATRMANLLQASWDLLDAEAKRAPESLRKGPRGGGRDRDKMLDHVIGAEAGYARKLGVKHKPPELTDRPAILALRKDIVAVIGAQSDGQPVVDNGWTTAYAARRIAWHVLDHLWEMQDRSES